MSTRTKPVRAIERAFTILDLVASKPRGIGVSEIARQVSLPKSTVSRLLLTLEESGAVRRLPHCDDFVIGARIIALTAHVPYAQQLIVMARPYLLELAEATGEAVDLWLLKDKQLCIIDQIPSRYKIQVRNWTGEALPLHASSPGKLQLVYSSELTVANLLAQPLERFTAKTITNPQALRQELAQIRAQGYAWTEDELEEVLIGLAAPIHDSQGNFIAALNVYGPAFRFPPAGEREQMTALIVELAQKIESQLRITTTV